MKKVSVLYRKDGDYVAIYEAPWYSLFLLWLAEHVCSCCGWRSWLADRVDWVGTMFWRISNAIYRYVDRHDEELIRFPVDGCVASEALWKSVPNFCARESCPVHAKK